ncbi:MAG: Flavodoxin reductase (ferredoxin-NADPH reductase) family 1 [Ilumatobacteraceae bacterium]|nr:Flavodoxin reductase (ferredoxin-NADPH reductase) family 1 [Ilumatobacteraceae bacterium]
MSSQIWWYTARAGGIVAWALLAASVLWGLAISTKATKGRVRPNWMLDMHRYLGGLSVVFVAIHVLGLVSDSYVHFGPSEILVPLTSTYRPSAVAWGVVAMYLLLAVELTSLARKRLSQRVWRVTHGLAFPVFAFSTVHGLLAGTDGTGAWLQATMIATSILVGALTLQRIVAVTRPRTEARPPATPGRAARPAPLPPGQHDAPHAPEQVPVRV